jgi:RHS repeat-associated protein
MPFGEIRQEIGTISQTDFSFTGQRSISMLSIMDYNARFYDPDIGRFVQPDTIIPSPANPQSWNRYSYVLNNPARYSDPSGHRRIEEECGMNGEDCGERVPASTWSSPENNGNDENGISISKKGRSKGGGGNDFLDAFEDIWSAFNWSVQTPEEVTIYQSKGFPFMGGYRFYGDIDIEFDNGSPITLGPTTTSFGPSEIGPNSFVFQTGESTIGAVGSALNLDVGNPLAPWGFNISADYSIRSQNVKATNTIGLEYVARPDNLTLITVAFILYEAPQWAVLLIKRWTSGNQSLCPGPACQ